jgi:hypothetical protein
MGMDLGGYNEAGDFRLKIWSGTADSNGNFVPLFHSDRMRTANNGTAVDVTRKTVDFVSKTHDSTVDANPETNEPPILNTSASGSTRYYWGFYATSGYTVSFQEQSNTSYNVYRDQQVGQSPPATYPASLEGVFDVQTTDSDKTLIGRIYYVYIPSPPVISSVSAGVRSVTVSVSGSSDDGGDPDGMVYLAQLSTTSNFSSVSASVYVGAGTTTISGLANNTTYYTRVFAANTATWSMGEFSSPTTWASTVTTLPLPNWSTGDTSITTEAVINTSYIEYGNFSFSAANANSYSVTSGSLPTGLTLTTVSGSGVLSGTPTTVGVYPFTVTATNTVGSVPNDFEIQIIGGAQVYNPAATTVNKWVKGTIKVWNGTAWVPGELNIRTGGAWKELG